MKDNEISKENELLQEFQEIINNSPQRIEQDFNRTDNSWLACFGSCLNQIETYLNIKSIKQLFSQEKYNTMTKIIEELKIQREELIKLYPDKTTTPPKEIKQELLDKLKNFINY